MYADQHSFKNVFRMNTLSAYEDIAIRDLIISIDVKMENVFWEHCISFSVLIADRRAFHRSNVISLARLPAVRETSNANQETESD